jgi:hypothetical protein
MNNDFEYNHLIDVDRAQALLAKINADLLLQELRNLIIDLKLQSHIGIRLLHRHNHLAAHEIMVEDEIGGFLVTAAVERSALDHDVFPNSWMLANSSHHPIEYSTDKNVRDANILVNGSESFFESFQTITDRHGVSDYIGPAVIRREFFKRKPNSEAILLETSDGHKRANYLGFANRDAFPIDRLVTTSWLAIETNGDDLTSCAQQNCVTHTACVLDAEGDHSEQSHHSFQHVYIPDSQA